MTFKDAVENTPDVQDAWRAGLGALKRADKTHVTAEDTRRLRGSVDLDAALAKKLPQDQRWDYGVGHQPANGGEMIYWIEIHPASGSGKVDEVLAKRDALKRWLHDCAPLLEKMRRLFVWVSSGETPFTSASPQGKRLAVEGVLHFGRVLRIENEVPP